MELIYYYYYYYYYYYIFRKILLLVFWAKSYQNGSKIRLFKFCEKSIYGFFLIFWVIFFHSGPKMNTVSFIANRSNEFSWFCTLDYSSRQSSKAKFLQLDFRGRKTRKWIQNGAFWSLWWMNAWCASIFFAWSCTSMKAWNCFKQMFFLL